MILNRVNSHVQGRELDIKEGKVISVIPFHFVHKLSHEQERGWGSEVIRVNVSKFDVFLVERCPDLDGESLHNVLVEVGGEGNVVDVVGVVKLLYNFQVCL